MTDLTDPCTCDVPVSTLMRIRRRASVIGAAYLVALVVAYVGVDIAVGEKWAGRVMWGGYWILIAAIVVLNVVPRFRRTADLIATPVDDEREEKISGIAYRRTVWTIFGIATGVEVLQMFLHFQIPVDRAMAALIFALFGLPVLFRWRLRRVM